MAHMWTFEKDKQLIELVQEKPALYDLQSPQHSDIQHRRVLWAEIEQALQVSGAKRRWGELRAQYRKYLSRQTMKNGQAAAKISKWRFSDQMSFLYEYINHTGNGSKKSSMIAEIESDDSDAAAAGLPHSSSSQSNDNEELEVDIKSANGSTNSTPVKRENPNKRTNQMESTSSLLMEYRVQQKKQFAINPVDSFFSSIAATVSGFSAVDQRDIKKKVFDLVYEIEEKYLTTNI